MKRCGVQLDENKQGLVVAHESGNLACKYPHLAVLQNRKSTLERDPSVISPMELELFFLVRTAAHVLQTDGHDWKRQR